MQRAVTLMVMAALAVGVPGCATKTQTGVLVGAGGGAAIGAVIGKAAGNTALYSNAFQSRRIHSTPDPVLPSCSYSLMRAMTSPENRSK